MPVVSLPARPLPRLLHGTWAGTVRRVGAVGERLTSRPHTEAFRSGPLVPMPLNHGRRLRHFDTPFPVYND